MTEFRKQLEDILKPFDKAYVDRNEINYSKIPTTKLELTDDNVALVNKITELLHKTEAKFIKRTRSGGISIKREDWSDICFDLRGFGAGIELTIFVGYSLRIQLGHVQQVENVEKKMSGRIAFNRFKKELAKDGINIENYALNTTGDSEEELEGYNVNDDIAKPHIKTFCVGGNIEDAEVVENVHHIDFHKAYMSGLYLSHPEMQKTIERLYEQRHADPLIKSIFTHTIGFMHSKMIKWKYANLAKDAINTFDDNFCRVANRLAKTRGVRILGYNTDGIWFESKNLFHDELEGEGLGQWSYDYTNCKIRYKSDGAYEFIDSNGKYYAKIRGKTRLDKIKPRDQWAWGDIFSKEASTMLQYYIKDGWKIEEYSEEE